MSKVRSVSFDGDGDEFEPVTNADLEPGYADDDEPGVAEEEEEEEESEEKEKPADEDEDDDKEKPEADDKKKPEAEADDKPLFTDEIVKELFDLDSVDELNETLKDYPVLVAEVDRLTAELENREPVFASEAHKKAYEFITNSPVQDFSRLGEYAHLMQIDEVKMDDKDALLEEYVLKRPNLSRTEATRLFERSFDKKYENYDDDDDVKLEVKDDSARARQYIAEQKAKYTPAKESKEADTNDNSVVSAAIEQNIQSFEKTFNGFQGLKLEGPDGDSENSFTFSLSKEKQKEVIENMKSVLSDPTQYDKKSGKHKNVFQAEQSRDTLIWALYGKEIAVEYGKHCASTGKEAIAGDFEKQVPNRKPTDLGTASAPKDIWAAFDKAGDARVTRKAKIS